MNKNNVLIFCRKLALCILANFLGGWVFTWFFDFRFLILLFIFYFLINLIAIILINTKEMMIILTLFDGLFFTGLLITLICLFIFIDSVEMASHGAIVTYPIVLSIIYFTVSFIRGILKIKGHARETDTAFG